MPAANHGNENHIDASYDRHETDCPASREVEIAVVARASRPSPTATNHRPGQELPMSRFHLPAVLAAAALLVATPDARADEAALAKRLDALSAQVDALLAEIARLKAESAANAAATKSATAVVAGATAPAAVASAPAAAPMAVTPAGTSVASATPPYAFPQIGADTVLSSYGELQYTRPTKRTDETTADVGRFVIGFQHRFDARNKMVAELEVEHAVSSADDRGEVEVEQAYVEHQFGDALAAKAGLFLIPTGLLNESHEPTAYYGVFRNHVETAIIPTTWRELGIGGTWRNDDGITVDAGLTTGFDLSKFDPDSDEGRESPLGSIHQEGQLARARSLSAYVAVNWRGLPGLQVGGSAFHGGAGQGQDFAGRDAKVSLYEGHVRWTPGPWDLAALYARGHISDTQALNETFVGAPFLVPQSFYGWYAQAAYRVWAAGDTSLAPFARYERFNTAKSFASLPDGLAPESPADAKVATAGVNFWLNPGIVFKADYQWFQGESTRNRLDLGAGYSF